MPTENSPIWTPEAQARLMQVPEGIMRELTCQRVEEMARRSENATVTLEMVEQKYRQWLEGSANAGSSMAWTAEAWGRIERIPPFIRGMVVKAIEAYAKKRAIHQVTSELVDEAKHFWSETNKFHEP